ncbi:hypothetical protein FD733_04905 [Pantoea sp. Eser]|nr:hypothetical protein [Pantoea sp. Eser]
MTSLIGLCQVVKVISQIRIDLSVDHFAPATEVQHAGAGNGHFWHCITGNALQEAQQLNNFSGVQQEKSTWLDIEVTTQEYLSDLQLQVETLTAELPVEVLLLRRSREQRQHSLARLDNETQSELKVEEVFARRLALDSELQPQQIDQMTTLFRQTLADIEGPQ